MKKTLFLLLTFLFVFQTSPLFAADEKSSLINCWACPILEGVYVYVFNFVYKLYDKFVPIVKYLVVLAMAFWFIWYIWTNVIKEQKANINSFFKEIVSKLLAYTFVLAFLSLPAKEIFRYTIDPIMNFGPNFAKWVLEEARSDNEMLKLASSKGGLFKSDQVQNFSCNDIVLSDYATRALNQQRKTALTNDQLTMDEDTLKNIICITREFQNTVNAGQQIGAGVVIRSLIGIGENKLVSLSANSAPAQALDATITGVLGAWGWLYRIVKWFISVYMWFVGLANFISLFVGLCIYISFLSISFIYLLTILDVIVKLAMVGVMMPITLGAWTFKNTRQQLSGPLFFNVVQCTFRIAFLSVAITIVTYLINEFLTIKFNAGPTNLDLESLLKMLGNEGKMVSFSTFFNGINLFSEQNQVLFTLIVNPTIIISAMFVCLICYYLLTESNNLANKFSSAIGSGVGEDVVFNGVKKVTTTSIKYFKSVVIDGTQYIKQGMLKDKINNENRRKRELEKILDSGKTPTIYDIPIEDAVDFYEDSKNLDEATFADENSPTPYSQKTTEEVKNEYEARAQKYTQVRKNQEQHIDNILGPYDTYKKLDDTEKSQLKEIVLSDNYEEHKDVIDNNAKLKDVVDEVRNNSKTTIAPDENPFKEIKTKVFNKEVMNYIDKHKKELGLGDSATRTLKRNISNNGGKNLTPQQRNILDKVETEIKSKHYKEKKKLDEMKVYKEFRENLEKYNKNEIRSKDLYLILKNDEMENLRIAIDEFAVDKEVNLDTFSAIKYSSLIRKYKKLKKQIDSIEDYSDDDFDNLVHDEIANYRKRQNKKKAPRTDKLGKPKNI